MNMAVVHDRVLEHQHYWPRELARLRRTLQADLARTREATR
jgi:hypothetical protein